MADWLHKGARVQVVGDGPYAGQAGKAVRQDGPGTWMVKLDGRMSGTSVAVRDLQKGGD